jgi:hypothetical protein
MDTPSTDIVVSIKDCFGRHDALRDDCLSCEEVKACYIKKYPASREAKEHYGAILFDHLAVITLCMTNIAKYSLTMGRTFYEIKQTKLYRYAGDHVKNMSDFARETGMSSSKMYYYVGIYEKFCVKLKQAPDRIMNIAQSKLRELLPIVNEQNVEELLQDAESLGYHGFMEQLRDRKGKLAHDKCDHDCTREVFERCTECGKWFKIEGP